MPSSILFLNLYNILMSLISVDCIFVSVFQVKRRRQHSLIHLPKIMLLESGRSGSGFITCDTQSFLPIITLHCNLSNQWQFLKESVLGRRGLLNWGPLYAALAQHIINLCQLGHMIMNSRRLTLKVPQCGGKKANGDTVTLARFLYLSGYGTSIYF